MRLKLGVSVKAAMSEDSVTWRRFECIVNKTVAVLATPSFPGDVVRVVIIVVEAQTAVIPNRAHNEGKNTEGAVRDGVEWHKIVDEVMSDSICGPEQLSN